LPREEADARALACCVVEWLNRHPAPSMPGRCAWCAEPSSASAEILPFGTKLGLHAWVHAECWPAWHRKRRTVALSALRSFGIPVPVTAPFQRNAPPELPSRGAS
jgi:hypothetical protein